MESAVLGQDLAECCADRDGPCRVDRVAGIEAEIDQDLTELARLTFDVVALGHQVGRDGHSVAEGVAEE